jgi:tripartite-type tricarboxylate transporter receptor subunit TctC
MMPDVRKVLFAAGLEPETNSPSEMRSIIEVDYKKWGELIQTTGLKAQ